MGFAEFSKIIQKAEEGLIDTPVVDKVKKVKEEVKEKETIVAKPPKTIQVKTKRRTRASEEDDEDIVQPQEPQIEIEITEDLYSDVDSHDEFDNVISLFDYDNYDVNKFTAIDATFSCIRFEQLKSELQDRVILKKHKFNIFNYRIYYSREYIYLANVILSKYKSEIESTEQEVVLTTVLSIPVLVINQSTLVMCKDYDDQLSVEHVLKVMLIEKFPNIKYYQIITLNNYAENTIGSNQEIDQDTVDEILSNLITIMNANKTYEYLDNEMCENCVFKATCQKHPQPLGFTLLANKIN